MQATRRKISLLLFVLAAFAAISPAAASLPKLPEPRAPLARGQLQRVDVDHLEATLLDDDEQPLAPQAEELAASPRFSLWWPPPALHGELLTQALVDTSELARLAEIAPSEPPSLPETRVWAFALFGPESQPVSNRVSRGDASSFGLGLIQNRDGSARTSLYAFVGQAPSMGTDPMGQWCLGFEGPCSRLADRLHEAARWRFPDTGVRAWDLQNRIGETILLMPADIVLRFGEGLGKAYTRLEDMWAGRTSGCRTRTECQREMDQAALDFLQAGGDLTVLYGLGEKATTAFAQGGKTYLGGVAQDVGTGLRQGHEAGQALGIIWTPEQEPLVAALQGFQQARRVRALIQGSEEIFKSEVAAAQASFPGASARNIGTIAGRNAQKRILELAGRLGIEAQAEARLTLPAGIISIPEEGLASYRVADVFLPRQRIAIELTLESSQDLAVLSIHKQGQIADYYLARVKPVIINAQ